MSKERRCVCQHGEFDHIKDNDRGMNGCQADVMTGDGPESCGCVHFSLGEEGEK